MIGFFIWLSIIIICIVFIIVNFIQIKKLKKQLFEQQQEIEELFPPPYREKTFNENEEYNKQMAKEVMGRR